MELNKEQLQRVEHYLDKKNITYIDVRFEVLDHIVSDIETKMTKENLDFETVFYNVTEKWNTQLKETTSMFFGLGFSAPKLVIQKAKKVYWKQYVLLFTSYFLPFILLTHFNFKIQNPTEFNFFIILKGILIVSFVSFMFLLLTKNNKIKTTYGFILKSQGLGAVTGLIVLLMFFTRLKVLDGISVGMFCSFIFMTFSYFLFYKKHQEAIKKYKIS
ncbi:hypothetical protein [Polaribacter sp. HaHaR_3_91]|uniref:hypothetical protein n=1 Tax=Polaribacter sp. HaHaR_3_91 TaxID=2745561 RepID=UPI001C4F160D|nr:hypothetical protein [Polaribacter sp. HaHaR_3_91]QXP63617.1 hypothetical protein H0I27_17570 [Polaribacter sp. HaHaR_3_91]